jgi:uncharacterized protein (TIGR00730 family)
MTAIRSLCVYCGSSSRVADIHKDAARTLGRLLAERGIALVYGGGRVGLMGLCAEAALAAGGEVVGIIPHHIQRLEVEHRGLTELHVVETMHQRKQLMFDRSDGFLVLAGGFGTLDETFEMVTWRQLGLHDKPIVLIDTDGYWQPVVAMRDHMVAAGFVRPEHQGLFQVAPTPEAALACVAVPQPAPFAVDAKWA